MTEEKDPKREGHEQDFSEFARHSQPPTTPEEKDGPGAGTVFLRGCAMVVGVVLLIFAFIVGTCFLR